MKKLLSTIALLVLANNSYAACEISYNASNRISNIIDKKGFSFDNYDKLCKKLFTYGATVNISEVAIITPTNAIGAVTISLMPTAKNREKELPFKTASGVSYIVTSNDRTTSGETEALYQAVMNALKLWENNPKELREAFQELDELMIRTRY